jgi:heterodisulfide reductase subunit A-like polyferredoxin
MNKKVVILGGGIAGLEAASDLATFGFDVHLIEKEDRLRPGKDVFSRKGNKPPG